MGSLRNCCTAVALIALTSTATSFAGANSRGGRITIPVMTALTVKLDEGINLKTAENGGGFTATFTQPVQLDGMTLIPAGASAAGLINKEPQYSLELNSVFVNGRSYRVTTTPIAINQKKPLPPGATFTFYLTLSLSIAK